MKNETALQGKTVTRLVLTGFGWRRVETPLLPLILASLALTGCTTVRYVPTPCLTPEQLEERRKAEPPLVGKELNGDAQHDIKPIAGSAVLLRSWGRGNLSILEGCTG